MVTATLDQLNPRHHWVVDESTLCGQGTIFNPDRLQPSGDGGFSVLVKGTRFFRLNPGGGGYWSHYTPLYPYIYIYLEY